MDYQCALSTFDNPYNPFDDFASWWMYDIEKGYDSSSRLARVANITDDMTEREKNIEIERAIDEIIKYDFMNVYIKVTNKLEIDD